VPDDQHETQCDDYQQQVEQTFLHGLAVFVSISIRTIAHFIPPQSMKYSRKIGEIESMIRKINRGME
jgi:hypothetical protein